jgi:hypothetical protein
MEQILGLQTKECLMRGLIALTLVLLSIHGLLTSKICERLMAGSWQFQMSIHVDLNGYWRARAARKGLLLTIQLLLTPR